MTIAFQLAMIVLVSPSLMSHVALDMVSGKFIIRLVSVTTIAKKISMVLISLGIACSIGSLGRFQGEKDVRNVAVSNCTFRKTQNGARIKTFHGSPVLQASNISFTDIIIENVTNPIIIDQNYFVSSTGE